MFDVGLRRSGKRVVGDFLSSGPSPGNSIGLLIASAVRKPGLRRPCGLNGAGLRRPGGFKFKDVPILFLRRCEDRNVPCRDKENGLFDDELPGLLLSCCDKLLGLF